MPCFSRVRAALRAILANSSWRECIVSDGVQIEVFEQRFSESELMAIDQALTLLERVVEPRSGRPTSCARRRWGSAHRVDQLPAFNKRDTLDEPLSDGEMQAWQGHSPAYDGVAELLVFGLIAVRAVAG